MEALVYRKKLLTNDKSIKSQEYFCKEAIKASNKEKKKQNNVTPCFEPLTGEPEEN